MHTTVRIKERSMREVRWERMFPDELEREFGECPLVYFAYGLCEPHGPQNALGLDALKAHAIACEAARAHGGIVAPPDYWHVHELGLYAAWAERAACRRRTSRDLTSPWAPTPAKPTAKQASVWSPTRSAGSAPKPRSCWRPTTARNRSTPCAPTSRSSSSGKPSSGPNCASSAPCSR